MAEIIVSPSGPDEFRVEVSEGGSSTVHQVTVTAGDLDRFGAGGDAERLVTESFRFLLERERKESILRSFELGVIARYFPEYPTVIVERLEGE